jgi:hypothetical protein
MPYINDEFDNSTGATTQVTYKDAWPKYKLSCGLVSGETSIGSIDLDLIDTGSSAPGEYDAVTNVEAFLTALGAKIAEMTSVNSATINIVAFTSPSDTTSLYSG